MATTTGRRQHLPCVSDSTNFASSTSIAQLAATTSSRRGMAHARAASVPAAPVAPQQGHHRSRSWLPSFFKPSSAHQPPVKPAPEPAAPSTTRLTRRSRSNSLGASLRRKMRHLTTADEAASLPPPPRPAPPTLLPDRDMLDLRTPKATPHPHHLSLPYGALASKARNCSWDWDGGDGNLRKGHTRGMAGGKSMSLDAGVISRGRLVRTSSGRPAHLASTLWEDFAEAEEQEGEVISFDLPRQNERKASVSSRRVPVPTYIPFPAHVTRPDQSSETLDISAQVNPDSSMGANTDASHLDLSSFPNPPLGSEPQRPEEEDEDAYVRWNTSAVIPSRQSSLASRRARALPSPLIIESEPSSAFDEPTPSPTYSYSIYSTEDKEELAVAPSMQHRASYFSPISPLTPSSPDFSPGTPASSRSAYSEQQASPSSRDASTDFESDVDRPISPLSPIPLPPRRSPILEGLAISSSGLLPSPSPRHRHTVSLGGNTPLALKTMKTLPLLPLPPFDSHDAAPQSHLTNQLPFDHTSFLSPFDVHHSPPRRPLSLSPALSPRTQPHQYTRSSPPRFAFKTSPTSRNLSASLHSSRGSSTAPYNPSPRLPTSSTFTATTRFSSGEYGEEGRGCEFSPRARSVESFETRASSVPSFEAATRVKESEEGLGGSEEEDENDDDDEEEEEEEEVDNSRIRGEKWLQREFGVEVPFGAGGWGAVAPPPGPSSPSCESCHSTFDSDTDSDERGEQEETIKVSAAYGRREVTRREDERQSRYAAERASLYAEPGPEEAMYVYGVAL